ncbi:MAG: M48 family metallopeptidase, partial [Fimbriimonadaceae bacterium]
MERYESREEFNRLVRTLANEAESDPEGFRRRAERAIASGFLVSALVFFGSLVLAGLLVRIILTLPRIPGFVILLIVVLAVPYALLSALLRRPEAHRGIRVEKSDAPKLWEESEQVAAQLGAPRLDEIWLGLDLNAAASQLPRVGVFGRLTNSLHLGLPLTALLTLDELRSVVAHEFGHFVGRHGALGYRIHAMCTAWQAASESSHLAASLVRPLLYAQARKLSAIDTAIRLLNEFDADRAGTAVAGRAAATALLRMGASGSEILSRDQRLYAEMIQSGNLGSNFVERIVANAREPVSEDVQALALEGCLTESRMQDDTHPSLVERITAIGEPRPSDIVASARAYAAELSSTRSPLAIDILFKPDELALVQKRLMESHGPRVREQLGRDHSEAAAKGELDTLGEDTSTAEGLEGAELAALLDRLVRRGVSGLGPVAARVLANDPDNTVALIVRASERRNTDPEGAVADYEMAAAKPGEYQTWCLGEALALAESLQDSETAQRLYGLLERAHDDEETFQMEIFGELAAAKAWSVPEPWRRQALEVLYRSRNIVAAFAVEFPSDVRRGETHRYLYLVPRYRFFRLASSTEARAMREASAIHAPLVMLDYG